MATLQTTLFIGGHEGKVLTWYLDPTGTPTIGYGATWASRVFREWFLKTFGRKMRRGDTLTEAQAVEVLRLMIEDEYEPAVRTALPNVKEPARGAATSTTLNCGPGALKWKWAQALARGDAKESARLLRVTATTSKGQRLPGLVRRRNEEADIIEFKKWPEWMATTTLTPGQVPATYISLEDLKQAQQWLKALGYYTGNIDGVVGGKTKLATENFQRDHGTLRVDGVIGRATLAALQRTIDLQSKGGKIIAIGGSTSATGVAEGTTNASDALTPGAFSSVPWLEPLLFWGGIGIIAIGVVYLAWRYQDEINALIRRL